MGTPPCLARGPNCGRWYQALTGRRNVASQMVIWSSIRIVPATRGYEERQPRVAEELTTHRWILRRQRLPWTRSLLPRQPDLGRLAQDWLPSNWQIRNSN